MSLHLEKNDQQLSRTIMPRSLGMRHGPKKGRHLASYFRAMIEIAFIIFLFYSNLLMGEFTSTNRDGKTLAFALRDIFTLPNFVIAIVAATIGYFVVEFLRKRIY